jgi:soluble lytic murein transglycosylase-like protein
MRKIHTGLMCKSIISEYLKVIQMNSNQIWFLLFFALSNGVAWAQSPIECLKPAATYHGVNPQLLLAVLTVESRLNPNAVNKNTNGTVDIGMGQINSIHLPELQRFGLNAEHLMDACKATYVSAWMLRRGFNRYGNSWFAAATYHSTTPVHNLRYQGLLKAELARQGVNLVVATAD